MRTSISSGGVVLNPEGKVVVVYHKKLTWSLPKGKREENEDLLGAAKREIYEETGISELNLVKKIGTYKRFKMNKDGTDKKDHLKIIVLFLFTTSQEKLEPKDDSITEARWVSKEEAVNILTHEKDKQALRMALKGIDREQLIAV